MPAENETVGTGEVAHEQLASDFPSDLKPSRAAVISIETTAAFFVGGGNDK